MRGGVKRSRFKVIRGYKVDKRIVRLCFLAVLLLLGYVFFWGVVHGTYYVSCPEDAIGGMCENPFFNNCPVDDWRFSLGGVKTDINAFLESNGLCDRVFLWAGESYGEKPPFVVENYGLFIIIIFVIGGVFNHVFHNDTRSGGGVFL